MKTLIALLSTTGKTKEQIKKEAIAAMAIWQEISGQDILKDIGPISREEYEYYNNPDNFKKN